MQWRNMEENLRHGLERLEGDNDVLKYDAPMSCKSTSSKAQKPTGGPHSCHVRVTEIMLHLTLDGSMAAFRSVAVCPTSIPYPIVDPSATPPFEGSGRPCPTTILSDTHS